MSQRTLDEYLKQTTPTKQPATKPKYRIAGFYKETRFQETTIGKIPKEWALVKIRELAIFMKRGKTPKYGDSDVIVIKTAHNYPDKIRIEEAPRASPSFIEKLPHEYYLKPGDILINSTGTGSVGRVGFFRGYIQPCTVDSHITILRINYNIALPEFVFYYLSSPMGFKALESRAVGSTNQIELYASAIGSLQIPLPPLEEQWGIAEVLSSVDEAIEVTDRLIGRLERLKRGLMQELLTKGIGHREYKQTPIGKIPKEWQVVRIENIAKAVKTGPFGSQLRKSELTRKGIKVYTQENVLKRDFSIGDLYISEKKFNQLKNFEVKPNDVLLTIRGTVGKAAVVPYHVERGIIHTNLAIIRVDNTKILPRYLELIINEADIIARQVKASHSSTTLPALYAGTIKRLKIPLPSLEEQKKIVDIISSVNKWIELERKRKEKFERLKRGLMELLLTGRVRVRVERLDGEENLPGSGGGAGF